MVHPPAQKGASIDQVACSADQLSYEHLQGWRFYNFFSSLSWCQTTLMEKTSPDPIEISYMTSICVSIAPCLTTVQLQEDSAPASLSPLCFTTEQLKHNCITSLDPALSFSSHIMYSSSWASWWSLVGFSPVHKYFSCIGELKTTLWSAEWRGEITTLNLMALLQLVHLVRLRQSFSSTKLHQTVVFYLSTGIPGSFLQRTKEVTKNHLGFIELNTTISVLQPVQFFNSLNLFLKNRFLFWF